MRRDARTAGAIVLALCAVSLPACTPGEDLPAEGGTTGTAAAPAPDSTGDGAGASGPEDGAATASSDDPAAGSVTTDDPARPVEITLAATGDILAHSTLNRSASWYAGGAEGAYDYSPMFADVAPLLTEADLALCHLETPLSPDNTNLSVPDTLSFNTPRQMADALAGAGIDGCDFASNHTMDRGVAGIAATEQVLRDAGMGYAGPQAEQSRAGEAEIYDVEPGDGGAAARVAHLAYTYTYPNSGTPTTDIPQEAPWLEQASWPVLGSEGIVEQARAAQDAGADFVVVSMHWGQEYQAQPTQDQTRIARDLLESGAVDLILGTHAHVIQPCEQVSGRHVIYGLGNFLSNQSPQTNVNLIPATQEGMVALATLRRDADGVVTTALSYQPTRVEISPEIVPSHIIRLATQQTAPETWERTTATVDLMGGCGAAPVSPAGRR